MPCFEGDAIPWDLEFHIDTKSITNPSLLSKVNMGSSGALCQQFSSGATKIYQFKLDLPTRPHLITFALGIFDLVRIPAAPFAMALCPLGTEDKIALAVEFFSRAFGFVNWLLSCSFPYPSFYLVFIKDFLPIDTAIQGANISLVSSLSLFDPAIIDQNLTIRRLLCTCLTEQYFGIRLPPLDSASRWLTTGISGYLACLLLRAFHGHNEFRFNLRQDMSRVLQLESGHAPLMETPEFFANPLDEEWFRLKSYLVVMVLDNRLEKGGLQRVGLASETFIYIF